jgi:hypothetical protein
MRGEHRSHRYAQPLTCVAVKKAINESVQCVDLLGFNACWMATLEVAYEMRNVAKVLVASQVYARPWPFADIVKSLPAESPQGPVELARNIVAAVRAGFKSGRKDAVSAFHVGAHVERLAKDVEAYGKHVKSVLRKKWPAVRDAVLLRAQRVDDPYQVDLMSLARVLPTAAGSNSAAQVQKTLKLMRIRSTAHSMHPGLNGLSIFCPKSTQVDVSKLYAGTEFKGSAWRQFLQSFQEKLSDER